jgi:hypothetical protein
VFVYKQNIKFRIDSNTKGTKSTEIADVLIFAEIQRSIFHNFAALLSNLAKTEIQKREYIK